MKYQFNKTELQQIQKQLKIRVQALPTLKNKEAALRAEVKKHRDLLKKLEEDFSRVEKGFQKEFPLFSEFDSDFISVKELQLTPRKIAGVEIPELGKVTFSIKDVSLAHLPTWFFDGIEVLKTITVLRVGIALEGEKINILESARKKTTQKVNLYEKVQIPEFEDAIIKIKRFLADSENLERAGQKIVKKRKVAVV